MGFDMKPVLTGVGVLYRGINLTRLQEERFPWKA